MLASKFRLKKKVLFNRVFAKGFTYQSRSFGLGVYKRGDSESSRVGFIVSTKISKKAVERNRIKRILSREVGNYYKDIAKGFDLVFLVKPLIMKTGEEEIIKDVKKTLQDARLL